MQAVDLVFEAFKAMSRWGTEPDEEFSRKFCDEHSAYPRERVAEALEVATKLQKLVLASSQFYNASYDGIHQKVREYLRLGAPGLSDDVYALAERRIMFMYIH